MSEFDSKEYYVNLVDDLREALNEFEDILNKLWIGDVWSHDYTSPIASVGHKFKTLDEILGDYIYKRFSTIPRDDRRYVNVDNKGLYLEKIEDIRKVLPKIKKTIDSHFSADIEVLVKRSDMTVYDLNSVYVERLKGLLTVFDKRSDSYITYYFPSSIEPEKLEAVLFRVEQKPYSVVTKYIEGSFDVGLLDGSKVGVGFGDQPYYRMGLHINSPVKAIQEKLNAYRKASLLTFDEDKAYLKKKYKEMIRNLKKIYKEVNDSSVAGQRLYDLHTAITRRTEGRVEIHVLRNALKMKNWKEFVNSILGEQVSLHVALNEYEKATGDLRMRKNINKRVHYPYKEWGNALEDLTVSDFL